MGSFSVACSGGGISITSGTRAAFVPLVPNSGEFTEKKKGSIVLPPMSMIVANDASMALYRPFSLPIFGEYNDYGSLENIERNSTVEALEKFFNLDIDAIMEIVTRNWCEDLTEENDGMKNKKVMQTLSGCFFDREIYDYLSKPQMIKNSEAPKDFMEDADVNSTTLVALGFMRDKLADLPEKARYYKAWKMPGDDKNVVYSDGTWSHVNKKDGLYHPKAFIKYWNTVSDVKIDSSKFENLSKYEFEYDDVVLSLKPTDNSRLAEIIADMNRDRIEYRLPIGRGSWDSSFKALYKEKMLENDIALKKEFLSFFNVPGNMWVNNRLFKPMYSGPQCGEPKAQLRFAEEIARVLDAQVKKYNDDEEDDEDEI
jgi:hypothetical protein